MRWLLVFLVCSTLAAAPPKVVDGRQAGMDPDRLARIPERMQEFVDAERVAGVVTLVARRGQVVALDAVGYTDIETKQPLAVDNIFQIHSMTKPVVALGVMMLAEEGRLSITDPVERHLPEFRGQRVIVERDGDRLVLAPPKRPITIRDLLTHTSGMPLNPPPGIGELHGALHKSLNDVGLVLSQQPLEFEPGTKWQYSNTGIAAAALIIERLSGMPFETFLAKRIFEPLGMVDTYIYPPKEKFHRMPTAYIQKGEELVKYTADPLGEGAMKFREGAKYPLPEGGLYSTAADLYRLYQLMLNGGALDGVRLLSPATVKVMTALHTGDIEARPGAGYGLGWQVIRGPEGQGGLASIGTYGHGGRYGTFCFIDPAEELIGVFMIHREGDGVERTAFQEIVYGALTE